MVIIVFALVVCAALLVPRINVNTDMTKYLPDDYPMKLGLDLVRENILGIDEQIQELGSTFGNGNDLMPTDLPRTLVIGVALVFLVLLIMCSSVTEVLLFLLTTMAAVALNMGTNAFLPSVSMLTNTLCPVLQMVLSMDYCIILMNRYRQERAVGMAPSDAIEGAVSSAAPSVLSSAFTTIVSLLMLTFIKLKIGADLGFVLAKGVALTLVCCFTVLPALIVWADKSLMGKVKSVPRFPSAPVARFQAKWRWPLAVLFVAIVALAAVFQSRTPIYFAPNWDSKASEEHESQGNPMLLVYSTADEAAIPELLRRLEADPQVMQTISYPTTLGRECTAEEMSAMMSGFSDEALPADLLRIVYYALAHPDMDGELSFSEMQDALEMLSDEGLMPENIDYRKIIADAMRPSVMVPEVQDEPAMETVEDLEPLPGHDPIPAVNQLPDDNSLPAADSIALPLEEPDAIAPADTVADVPAVTWDDVHRQRTAADIAAFVGAGPQQINMVFRLAGKAGGTMSLAELYTFTRDNILSNKRYSAFVPQDMKEKFNEAGKILEAVIAAGPPAEADPETDAVAEAEPLHEPLDSTPVQLPVDTVLVAEVAAPEPTPAYDSELTSASDPELTLEPIYEPTPLDRLLDIMASGRRYPSGRMYSALSGAGIPVSRDDLDLLYLYTLSIRDFDPEQTATPERLLNYVADTLMAMPSLGRLVPEDARQRVDSIRTLVSENSGKLRGPEYSIALVTTGYPSESDPTFEFVDKARAQADSLLPGTHYWIGESEMYKELKDAFPSELTLLTILTVLAIYLIVALTFRSLLIPVPLVLSVLTGVYVNVIASGFGGGQMYYLSYLIVQGILMGAAIDYSILFTSYFRDARKSMPLAESIRSAFEGSSHSVLTSGLILSLVPMVMSVTMGDPMIAGILKSLSIGAFSAVLIILFLLPAALGVLDPIINRKIKYNED